MTGDALAVANLDLVEHILSRIRPLSRVADDVRSEAQLALLLAARAWQPERTPDFRVFALRLMFLRVKHLLRCRGINGRLVTNRPGYTPPGCAAWPVAELSDGLPDSRAVIAYEHADARIDADRLLACLPRRQALELRLHAGGVTLKQLGPSESAASWRLARARAALRAAA